MPIALMRRAEFLESASDLVDGVVSSVRLPGGVDQRKHVDDNERSRADARKGRRAPWSGRRDAAASKVPSPGAFREERMCVNLEPECRCGRVTRPVEAKDRRPRQRGPDSAQRGFVLDILNVTRILLRGAERERQKRMREHDPVVSTPGSPERPESGISRLTA